ncbi:MAG: hypothetical protein EBS53_15255 [Bacteroidetes bacterium]|nr:hypothetical protein [Bacteroidota bacterium]
MNLYIEIIDGQTINHPAFEDNLLNAFGSIPAHWEPFVRVERPTLGVYDVLESNEPTYEKVNGVWTDVWSIRAMTNVEKAAKQQEVKDVFNAREQAENWSAWTFDEATCSMQPPIPRPAPDEAKIRQGIMTFWCGADNNWKDTPVKPEGNYKFDFLAWAWVAA